MLAIKHRRVPLSQFHKTCPRNGNRLFCGCLVLIRFISKANLTANNGGLHKDGLSAVRINPHGKSTY